MRAPKDKDLDRTLSEFLARWPQASEELVRQGVSGLSDPALLASLGGRLTLREALSSKGIGEEALLGRLSGELEPNDEQKILQVRGVLPCPVKLPLLEGFERHMAQLGPDRPEMELDLRAASAGVDWLRQGLRERDPSRWDDAFLSAGFELFFDAEGFGRYRGEGRFTDLSGWETPNPGFAAQNVHLSDPLGEYGVLAVVPAVFLINSEELEGRPEPTSWSDLLHTRWQGSVSLPVGDFDLFNAMLLHVHDRFGPDGVRALGRSMSSDLHPAQMVQSHGAKDSPAITIMPWFFSRMILPGSPMKAVWPRDGAIASPVFLVARREAAERIRPALSWFYSLEAAEVLSHRGRFPSAHPEVDNGLGQDQPLWWIGWETIDAMDVSGTLERCLAWFQQAQGRTT